MVNEQNRAAIYCRLSKDDDQNGDSVSIETQKMILTSYCASQNFEIIDIYVDDGYSGSNFNRPAFKRLIKDLENGRFDIVITKDLSRLGRDYIQTGYYIDVYFSIKHIRYIAVNDGIDTLLGHNDIAPFKNILNDMYARDLSRKIKTAKYQRAKNGLYVSARPAYGYKVDPHNKNKLIIDPEPAKVVKYIFELAYAGNNYQEIARELERKQFLSPSVYKVMNGESQFLKLTSRESFYRWSDHTIQYILRNPVYVGDMVNHRVEIINYKTRERIKVPIENQIIIQNTHEAIVDRNIFEIVNKMIVSDRNPKHNYENILRGLIFCSECGSELLLIAKRLKEETKPMFRCPKHAKDHSRCTHYHFIYYDVILDEIKKQIAFHITAFINSNMYDELCRMVLKEINIRAQEMIGGKLQTELQTINKSIKEKGKASSADITELEALYNAQRALIRKITDTYVDFDAFSTLEIDGLKATIRKYIEQIVIDSNIIRLFISRIEIGHLDKRKAKKGTQKIKIFYRFKAIPSSMRMSV